MVDVLSAFVTFIVFIISSIPLYLAVKWLGGKTTLFKTALVSFIAGLVVAAIRARFRLIGGIIAFIVLLWIYREFFRLKWHKAFLAWFLQFLILALLYLLGILLAALIVGVSFVALV